MSRVALVLPPGWQSPETEFTARLGFDEEAIWDVAVVPSEPGRRFRIAIDVRSGG